MKISIHVAHDQMNQLLEPKAFENYNESPLQVRLVFTSLGDYFEIYDWFTNYTYKVCIFVQQLNRFFLYKENWSERGGIDGKGPSHSDE